MTAANDPLADSRKPTLRPQAETMPLSFPGTGFFVLAGIAVGSLLGPLPGALAADASPPPAKAKSAGEPVQSLDALLASLDKNRDGKISRAEATGASAQRFTQWDANGDGFATRQEIHDFRISQGIDDRGQRITAAPRRPARAPAPRRAGADTQARILLEPTSWRLETMPLPPAFAPDVRITGREEIRFAPGMFEPASTHYFTCVLAIVTDTPSDLGATDIADFLERYYRGLSSSVGRRKRINPDPEHMRATVDAAPPGPTGGRSFTAQIGFIDSFSDGRKITLNVEARVISLTAVQKSGLILLVSTRARDTQVWATLREIGEKATKTMANLQPDTK